MCILILFFIACKKERDTIETNSNEDSSIVSLAKDWYKTSLRQTQIDADIDLHQLIPDWTNFRTGKNSAGQEWISVELKRNPLEKIFLTELSVVVDEHGIAHGLFKEFNDNPYHDHTTLTTYTGDGKIYLSGLYLPERGSVLLSPIKQNNKDRKPVRMTLRESMKGLQRVNEDDGVRVIETVEITAPRSNSQNPDLHFFFYDNVFQYAPPTQDNGGGGGSTGVNHTAGPSTIYDNLPAKPLLDDEIAFTVVAPEVTIDLKKRLDCFKTVPNNGATYSITLHAHKGVGGSNKPGHAFITLEKSNGNNIQRLSYGFYPVSGPASATMQNVPSAIGEESGDEFRLSDSRYSLSINAVQFQQMVKESLEMANENYHLLHNNCVHYATNVFNLANPPTGKINNHGFVSPDDLNAYLRHIKALNPNQSGIETHRTIPPPSTKCN